MTLSRNESRVRELMSGDVLDISPYCGPGPAHTAGVRVIGLPRFSCHEDVKVDGKPTRVERWRIPSVCVVCEKPYFYTAPPCTPVRLRPATLPGSYSNELPF
ncbi:hypothetical protein [Streptomyces sp. NPDC088794]|uniref:hypothetical protein n=1 Tax=Streptomyces sp. NPDC088794 TaxID=3365902 RepID=UPI0037FC6566